MVSLLQEYYGFSLSASDGIGVDAVVAKYRLQKLTLLRAFCAKNGVQVLLREYQLDSRGSEAFLEDDVVSLFFIVF